MIDLTVPCPLDMPIWADWFNDSSVTKFLPQGVFPNNECDQEIFLRNSKESGRILLMIKSKKGSLLGVTSISNIDYLNSSCQVASVVPIKAVDAPLAAIEARSLTLTHVFEVLNLKRCWHASVYPGNIKWLIRNFLLGFIPEGIQYDAFQRNMEINDVIVCSISRERYSILKAKRNNSFMPRESFFSDITRIENAKNNILNFIKINRQYRELVTNKDC